MNKIALGVSSSISIYKACEIIRLFQSHKKEVQVIMTKNAAQLVSPRLFSALSGNEVFLDLFDERASQQIAHINLAGEIELFLIAPATANVIGKLASGVADDFLSTFYLAVTCPVAVAPAMNEKMYLHSRTQTNIQILKASGVEFIEPEQGYLACGDEGWGRLASPQEIVSHGLQMIKKSSSLKGKKVLVTAGPTRESLDPVRYISNRSSGKMGYALADVARHRGAEVTLISGPTHLYPPSHIKFIQVESAADMASEVKTHFKKTDVLIMAAAVSDYQAKAVASQKIKKKDPSFSLDMERTQDILSLLGEKKGKKILVGFAAETENIKDHALGKLREKNLDLIVANDVSQPGIGFEADKNQVSIYSRDGQSIQTEILSKREISQIILDQIEGFFDTEKSTTPG